MLSFASQSGHYPGAAPAGGRGPSIDVSASVRQALRGEKAKKNKKEKRKLKKNMIFKLKVMEFTLG